MTRSAVASNGFSVRCVYLVLTLSAVVHDAPETEQTTRRARSVERHAAPASGGARHVVSAGVAHTASRLGACAAHVV